MFAVTGGYLNHVPVKEVKEYEEKLYALLENKYPHFLERVESGYWDDEDIDELKKALDELKR